MHRNRSHLWFNIPGLMGAWQPVRAPDPLLARTNVGMDGRFAGKFTARPGVLPTWASHTGWSFDGVTQYLDTGCIPPGDQTATWIVAANPIPSGGCVLGTVNAAGTSALQLITASGTQYISNAGYIGVTPITSGVVGAAGGTAYLNGTSLGSLTYAPTTWLSVYLGCRNNYGSPASYAATSIRAVALFARVLSAAEMWTASRQIAYCHANPDWSAWSPRRRYYFPPAAVIAGRVIASGARPNVALPGGPSITPLAGGRL